MLHLPALVEEDRRLVLVGLHAREQRGEVLDRMVRLQVRGLVREVAVADRVRLVERVVGERLDRVEDLLAERPVVTLARRSRRRTSMRSLRDERAVLLPRRLPEVVGLLERVAGEPLRDAHQLLLVDHQPVRRARGSPRGRGAGTSTGLRPFLRSAYSLCQFWAIGPGPVQRDERGDVLERRRRQRAQQRADRPAFQLEHADRVAAAEHLERLRGRRAGRCRCRDGVPWCASTRSSVISSTSRLRRPRKSILSSPRSSTPCISYCVTIGRLGEVAAGLGLALDRQVLGERLAGDDDRGGVDAVLAPQALEARARRR